MGGRAPCSQKPRSQEAARRAIGVGIRVRRKSWDQQRLLERAERGGAYLSSGFEAVVKTGLGSGIQIAQKSELNRRVATAMGAARTATAVVVEGGIWPNECRGAGAKPAASPGPNCPQSRSWRPNPRPSAGRKVDAAPAARDGDGSDGSAR